MESDLTRKLVKLAKQNLNEHMFKQNANGLKAIIGHINSGQIEQGANLTVDWLTFLLNIKVKLTEDNRNLKLKKLFEKYLLQYSTYIELILQQLDSSLCHIIERILQIWLRILSGFPTALVKCILHNSKTLLFTLYKFIKSIHNFDIQLSVLEVMSFFLGSFTQLEKENALRNFQNDEIKLLIMKLDAGNFCESSRKFLNDFNMIISTDCYVYSVVADSGTIGIYNIKNPMDNNGREQNLWINFNSRPKSISFQCDASSFDLEEQSNKRITVIIKTNQLKWTESSLIIAFKKEPHISCNGERLPSVLYQYKEAIFEFSGEELSKLMGNPDLFRSYNKSKSTEDANVSWASHYHVYDDASVVEDTDVELGNVEVQTDFVVEESDATDARKADENYGELQKVCPIQRFNHSANDSGVDSSPAKSAAAVIDGGSEAGLQPDLRNHVRRDEKPLSYVQPRKHVPSPLGHDQDVYESVARAESSQNAANLIIESAVACRTRNKIRNLSQLPSKIFSQSNRNDKQTSGKNPMKETVPIESKAQSSNRNGVAQSKVKIPLSNDLSMETIDAPVEEAVKKARTFLKNLDKTVTELKNPDDVYDFENIPLSKEECERLNRKKTKPQAKARAPSRRKRRAQDGPSSRVEINAVTKKTNEAGKRSKRPRYKAPSVPVCPLNASNTNNEDNSLTSHENNDNNRFIESPNPGDNRFSALFDQVRATDDEDGKRKNDKENCPPPDDESSLSESNRNFELANSENGDSDARSLEEVRRQPLAENVIIENLPSMTYDPERTPMKGKDEPADDICKTRRSLCQNWIQQQDDNQPDSMSCEPVSVPNISELANDMELGVSNVDLIEIDHSESDYFNNPSIAPVATITGSVLSPLKEIENRPSSTAKLIESYSSSSDEMPIQMPIRSSNPVSGASALVIDSRKRKLVDYPTDSSASNSQQSSQVSHTNIAFDQVHQIDVTYQIQKNIRITSGNNVQTTTVNSSMRRQSIEIVPTKQRRLSSPNECTNFAYSGVEEAHVMFFNKMNEEMSKMKADFGSSVLSFKKERLKLLDSIYSEIDTDLTNIRTGYQKVFELWTALNAEIETQLNRISSMQRFDEYLPLCENIVRSCENYEKANEKSFQEYQQKLTRLADSYRKIIWRNYLDNLLRSFTNQFQTYYDLE